LRGINEALRREMVAVDVVLVPDSDTLGKYRVQQTRKSAYRGLGLGGR
jgi:hypothetical protein